MLQGSLLWCGCRNLRGGSWTTVLLTTTTVRGDESGELTGKRERWWVEENEKGPEKEDSD